MASKPTPKTAKQIAAEAKELREIMPRVRHYSSFGDDNHRTIEAQLDVLENDLSEDTIYDRFSEDDDAEDLANCAMDARRWMDGEETDGGLVENWKPLVIGS
jgi:hypothetical protein